MGFKQKSDIGVQPHSGSKSERFAGIECHHHRADNGSEGSCCENRRSRHSLGGQGAEYAGIDGQDVGHREEGVRRGVAIDSDAERMAWIKQYEREVRRDEWGLIGTEVELLNNAYIDLATSEVEWADICPNVRLLDLALQLVTTYMRYLTVETFRNHIWEC